MEKGKIERSRRDFFSKALPTALGIIGAGGLLAGSCNSTEEEGEKVALLSPDGKLVYVNKSAVNMAPATPEEARQGIPGKQFVMVIDLARGRNARKCITDCQKMHNLPPEDEWIKVFLMQDSNDTAPYWFPKPCFHCNQPPCVKVCPVGATYKRTDGIVLVDNERCIGCKFCMTACPYSSRVFQWKETEETEETHDMDDMGHVHYSPETSIPSKVGTVGKCDFCPDMARLGKLPDCVTGCPNGVIFFGDKNEDIVSNGSETFRFSELIHDRAGYHFMAELGTEPNVYYLPPVDRLFDYKTGFKYLTKEQGEFYKNSIVKKH
jgi:molybdopterin-containing oxidoreductase family iron-sulfur binding subunit